MSIIDWNQDESGIVTLTIDAPGRSANTLDAAFVAEMTAVLERLRADEVTGVVITSAKRTFVAGGDLNEMLAFAPGDRAAVVAYVTPLKALLRALETLGKPVVAALGGAALGGGFELALATHHRIALDAPGVFVTFPEVALGLLPAAGGIVRTVRMLGVATAVGEVLSSNKRFTAAQALELGLVDELVSDQAGLVSAAKAWITANPDAVQPWDRPGFRLPGGNPSDPAVAVTFSAFPAALRKQLKGADLPAYRAILAAAIEGAEVDFANAEIIETRYFASIAAGPIAKNLIKSQFFDLQTVKAGASRPQGVPPFAARKVGILGAGMMGAAIAYVSAKAGIEVVLKDTTLEAAQRGKAYSEKILERAIERGSTTAEAATRLLDRIRPSDAVEDFAGVDFVVEAVFESVDVKQAVFQSIERIVEPDAVLGSNTSTLPITALATGVARPDKFVGVHFFSPVDKMPLVELIVGEGTSDETLARAFDFALQIGKTPIVVNDSRGFFTSRVITSFINEAVAALGAGVDPASIEQAGLQAGYPAGPLQLMDELTLTLPRKIREVAKREGATGVGWMDNGAAPVVDRMIDEFGRPGRSGGAGFYEYSDENRRLGLWPGLREAFGTTPETIPLVDLKERMLFIEAIESVRCLDEGVLRSVTDANVGSLLGIGYPAWTGGVFQYMNSYEGGLAGFVERARELAARYGDHLTPPDSLVEKAARGESYE